MKKLCVLLACLCLVTAFAVAVENVAAVAADFDVQGVALTQEEAALIKEAYEPDIIDKTPRGKYEVIIRGEEKYYYRIEEVNYRPQSTKPIQVCVTIYRWGKEMGGASYE